MAKHEHDKSMKLMRVHCAMLSLLFGDIVPNLDNGGRRPMKKAVVCCSPKDRRSISPGMETGIFHGTTVSAVWSCIQEIIRIYWCASWCLQHMIIAYLIVMCFIALLHAKVAGT